MTRRAVTLPELLAVLVLTGILLAIGVPRVLSVANRASLRSARGEVLRALDAGRGAAIRLGQPVEMVATFGALQILPANGSPALWQTPGPGQLGVAVTGLTTPIRFGPSGIATGASNRTIRLGKGSDTMVVIVSRLGRVRW
jgi:prepilin-type N-terminal cleavage/methylation domain-containing protein